MNNEDKPQDDAVDNVVELNPVTDNSDAEVSSIHKILWLKTKQGEELSMPVELADYAGRDSAVEYLQHVYKSIKEKMGEPDIFVGAEHAMQISNEDVQKWILFIAQFHDAVFGSFSKNSKLPDNERVMFIETFFVAVASVMQAETIYIDLSRGKIEENRPQ